MKHTGNCWVEEAAFGCRKCGRENMCDVCHLHDQPRGECEECPPPEGPAHEGPDVACTCPRPSGTGRAVPKGEKR